MRHPRRQETLVATCEARSSNADQAGHAGVLQIASAVVVSLVSILLTASFEPLRLI